MAPGTSTPYTPAGVILDVVIVLVGLAIACDLRHIPRHAHSVMKIAWIRMGEQGGFDALARIYLVLGVFPFWFGRLFFLALTITGVGALIGGPH